MLLSIFIVTPILLLVITICFRINIRDNYLFWIFFIIFVLLFYFIPVINYGSSGFTHVSFNSSNKGYINDVSSVMKLYIFQTLFYLMLLIGYIMIKPKKNGIQINNVLISSIDTIVLISSVLGLLGTIGSVYFSGMSIQHLLVSSRFDYWQTKSTYLFLISTYLQSLLVISTFLFFFIKKKYIKAITVIGFVAIFFVNMVVFGSRSIFIAICVAFLFGKIAQMKSKNKKIKYGKFIVLGIILLHLIVVWQYVRYNKSSFQTLENWVSAVFNIREAYSISLLNGDLNYFFGSALASFNSVPSIHGFLYGSTYIRVLLFFLPSSLAHFKPEETQRIFAKIINPQAYSIGATFPPSFIGDSYINFGFFGIFIGLCLGLLLKTWQNTLNGSLSINKIAIGSSGFLFLFLFIRGTFNGMYNLIFVWFFLKGFFMFINLISNKS